jgi:predicted enzyme related to lactoylglutathione lyase
VEIQTEITMTAIMGGTFCWNQIVTRDRTKASNFHCELFEQKVIKDDCPGMEHITFKKCGNSVGSMMQMHCVGKFFGLGV